MSSVAQQINAATKNSRNLEEQRKAYESVCRFEPNTFFCKFNADVPNELHFVKENETEVVPCCIPRRNDQSEKQQDKQQQLIERLQRLQRRVGLFYTVVEKAYADLDQQTGAIVLERVELGELEAAEKVLRKNMEVAQQDIAICARSVFSSNFTAIELLPPSVCEPMQDVLSTLEEKIYPAVARIDWIIGTGRAKAQREKALANFTRGQNAGYVTWFLQGTKILFTRITSLLHTIYDWSMWALGLLWTHGMDGLRAVLRFYRDKKPQIVALLSVSCANSTDDKRLLYYAYKKGYIQWKCTIATAHDAYKAAATNAVRLLTVKHTDRVARYLHSSVRETIQALKGYAEDKTKVHIVSRHDIDLALSELNLFLKEESKTHGRVNDLSELEVARWMWIIEVWTFDKLNVLTRGLCSAFNIRAWSLDLQIQEAEAKQVEAAAKRAAEEDLERADVQKQQNPIVKPTAAEETAAQKTIAQQAQAKDPKLLLANEIGNPEEALPPLLESVAGRREPAPDLAPKDAAKELAASKNAAKRKAEDALLANMPSLPDMDGASMRKNFDQTAGDVPVTSEMVAQNGIDPSQTEAVLTLLFKLYWMFFETNVVPTSDIDDDLQLNYGATYGDPNKRTGLGQHFDLPHLEHSALHKMPVYARYAFCRAQGESAEKCATLAKSAEPIAASKDTESQYQKALAQAKEAWKIEHAQKEAQIRQEEASKLLTRAEIRSVIETQAETRPPKRPLQPFGAAAPLQPRGARATVQPTEKPPLPSNLPANLPASPPKLPASKPPPPNPKPTSPPKPAPKTAAAVLAAQPAPRPAATAAGTKPTRIVMRKKRPE